METKVYNKKRLKKASLALAIIFALMLLFTILSWGAASGWGDVTIKRVSFIGNGGAQVSGLMFVPKGVSAANPAPAIINYHGRNCSSYSMINWAIEEARRGYVVLNPDMTGTLETENTVDNTLENIARTAYEYMNALEITTDISVTGHSMGNRYLIVLMQDEEIQKDLNSVVGVAGIDWYYFLRKADIGFPTQTNYCIIEPTKDIYNIQYMKTWDAVHELLYEKSAYGENTEFGKVYGDPSNGTAFEYTEITATHQEAMYSDAVITEMLNFIGLSSPAPTSIDNTNMVFHSFRLYSAVCTILFILFVAALAYTLTQMPLFYSTINVPLQPTAGKNAKGWIIQVATDYLIPLALFVPVSQWAAKQSTAVFRSEWVNQIFFWITAVAIIGAIMLAIRCVRKSKTSKLTAADFGTGTVAERPFVWGRIGVGLVITLITVFVAFTWMDIVIRTFGVNYQFFCLLGQINRVTPERIVYILPYLVVCIFLVAVINISIATSRRIKSTGNETLDLIRDILVNILLSAGPLTLLMVVQFTGVALIGNGTTPLSTAYFGSLSFGFMFPLMMASSAGISTFLYKKTGNICTGMFTSSFTLIFITILNCCVSSIVIK